MEPFKLVRAQNNATAIAAATSKDTKFIAGGTNIIDLMKLYIETPKQLVDITGLNLNQIETQADGSIKIGALVKNTTVAYHPAITKQFPMLSEAILSGATAQLRNMASVGGNLLQRPRCYYFYDTAFPCNKREPGTGCSAIPGYNRNHAVLGTTENCIATHPSDMCVPMAALGATIQVQTAKGVRSIPFNDFYIIPGKTPQYETILRPGELITSVTLPNLPFAAKSHYLKVRDRASYEFALTSAAVALDIANGKINNSRIALGGVATKPWRSLAAEKVLNGASANAQTFKAAADAAMADAKPHKYNAFKIELAKRTIVRALETVGGMV
ncbi:xanthine dehydrogenase family protein subunit M [uncultured Mucilaginibacter sp.]|uniref:FAD binding domain-containing protein n=1 Tax=uncultured Mucilaginibacter sp. TaxID=797541 RepID=UPI0026166A7A|nr:xanthine dehydrogenase family protein subunit M [uncultured Mucilaginibacter sp.]